jgi:hypothetical protein
MVLAFFILIIFWRRRTDMKIFQNGLIAVVGAIAATGVYLFGLVGIELYATFLGLVGFAGLAGLRSAIQSSGKKTYIIAAGGSAVAILLGFGLIPIENAAVVLGVLGIVALPALAHSLIKAKS